MFIRDDEQGDVGHGCPFSAVTSNTLLLIEEKRLLAATKYGENIKANSCYEYPSLQAVYTYQLLNFPLYTGQHRHK